MKTTSCKVLVILIGFEWNLNFLDRISEKGSNIKFYQNPSSVSRVIPCGRTDGHDEANSRFPRTSLETLRKSLPLVQSGTTHALQNSFRRNPSPPHPSTFRDSLYLTMEGQPAVETPCFLDWNIRIRKTPMWRHNRRHVSRLRSKKCRDCL
jgi:hypothetical protein